MITGVVFQNFSLSDPTAKGGQVLWPLGLLQPGIQQGANMPLKLWMQDVEILTDLSTLQQYIRFFQSKNAFVYTVRRCRTANLQQIDSSCSCFSDTLSSRSSNSRAQALCSVYVQ